MSGENDVLSSMKLDASQYKFELASLNKALTATNDSVKDIVVSNVKLDESGKIVARTLNVLTEQNRKAIVTLKELKNTTKISTKIIDFNDAESQLKRFQKSLKTISTEMQNSVREARENGREEQRIIREREAAERRFAQALRTINREMSVGVREVRQTERQAAREREREIQTEIRLWQQLISIQGQAARESEAARRRADARAQRATADAVTVQRRDAANIGTTFFGNQFNSNLNRASASELNGISTALGRINRDIASGRVSLNEYRSVWDNITHGTMGNLNRAQLGIASNLVRLRESFNNVGQTGNNSGESILLSWRGVLRLFVVQTLHQSLNQLLFLFRSNADEAAKFSLAIGEVLTISQGTTASYNQLNSELIKLSDSFGLSPLDVTAAAYEAVSNQVVNAAKSYDFLNESLKFAAVTQTDAKTATNLLSSAINSYKLSAIDAEKVSAVFFEIINLGRVRAEEMGDTFGRVGALASKMGIDLEEVGASITVLTRQGIRYSEAYTLINNIVLKLLKPTGEFKDLLLSYGFASGEAAIKTIGFGNVLKILDIEAQKGNARLGELLDEMRAIRGAAGLTGNSFKEFNEDVSKIRGAEAIDRYRKALDIVNQTSGKQFLVNTQQIKNYFTNTLGKTFVETFNLLVSGFGGASNSAKVFLNTLVTGLTTLSTYFISIRTGTILMAAWTTAQNAASIAAINGTRASIGFGGALLGALRPVHPLVLGITAAVGVLSVVLLNQSRKLEDLKNNTQKVFDSLAVSRENYMKRIRDSLLDEENAYKETVDNIFQTVGTANAKIKSSFSSVFDKLKTQFDSLVKDVKSSFDIITNSVTDKIRETEKAIDTAIEKANRAFERSKDIRKDIPKVEFEQKVTDAQNDESKVQLFKDELNKLTTEANKQALTGNLEQASELLQESIERAQELDRLLTNIYNKNSREGEKAAKEKAKALKASLDSEAKVHLETIKELDEQINNRNNRLTPGEVDNLKRRRDTVEEQRKRAQDASKRVDEATGTVKDAEADRLVNQASILALMEQQAKVLDLIKSKEEQNAEALKRRKEAEVQAQKQLEESLNKVLDIKITNDKGEAAFVNVSDIEKQFAEARKVIQENTQLSITEKLDAITKLNQLEQNAIAQFEASKNNKLSEERQNELLRIKQFYEDKAKELSSNIAKEEEDLNKNASNVKSYADTLTKILKELYETQLTQVITAQKVGQARPADLQQLDFLKKALETLNSLATSDTVTPETVAQLEKIVDLVGRVNFANLLGADKETKNILINEISGMNQLAVATKASADNLIKLREQQQALRESLQNIENKLKKDLPEGYTIFANSADAASQKFDLAIKRNELSVRRLIGAISELESQVRDPGLGPGFPAELLRNFGGLSFYNFGGRRGLDVRPAMLRPDEFVLSAAATRRNFSQVVALNAGNTPKHFNSGGQVTNIGDVNVTVVGGDSSTATVSNIGKELKRQIRLGRIKFGD